MVVQNEMMNAVSKQYNMSFVTKADIANKYTEQNNTDAMTDVAASVSLTKKVDNEVSAYTGIIDKAQESVTKNQVADMSLAEMNKKLYKITQLSIQASYESTSFSDKKEIQDEIHKLRLEIQNIGKDTTFNGGNVFDTYGKNANVNANINNNMNNDTTYNDKEMIIGDADTNSIPKIGIDYNGIVDELKPIDVTKEDGTKKALEQTNKVMDYVDAARSYIQSEQNRLIQVIQSAVGMI